MKQTDFSVVIDTNILIGSTDDEFSHSKRIVDEVIAGNITAYATNPIIRENQLLLDQLIPNPKHKEFLEDYFAQVIEVPITYNYEIIEWDHEDDKYINAALSADATYIISSDAHLLEHDGFEELVILKPDDFWNKYESENDTGGAKKMLEIMGL